LTRGFSQTPLTHVLAFVASHVTEAIPALGDGHGVRFLHFVADVSGDEPRFDYRLREGVSHQRLGMTLLERRDDLRAESGRARCGESV
jgi:DNA mismatch repair ATPase MutS